MSSEFYGVSYNRSSNRWYATYKGKHIGVFDTERQAAIAIDKYIIKQGEKPVNVLKRLR